MESYNKSQVTSSQVNVKAIIKDGRQLANVLAAIWLAGCEGGGDSISSQEFNFLKVPIDNIVKVKIMLNWTCMIHLFANTCSLHRRTWQIKTRLIDCWKFSLNLSLSPHFDKTKCYFTGEWPQGCVALTLVLFVYVTKVLTKYYNNAFWMKWLH